MCEVPVVAAALPEPLAAVRLPDRILLQLPREEDRDPQQLLPGRFPAEQQG